MAIKIAETFTVRAPAERVWSYLLDPRQVVECLPGAELTEVQDERTFLGRVRVKVGPVVAAYSGRAQILEVDEGARRIRLGAEGKETGGAGSAKMTMTSSIASAPDGVSVRVEADVDVAGKIVQFGRGMIESVSKQLFKQFAECVRARLEIAEATPLPPSPADPAFPSTADASSGEVSAPRPASAPNAPVRMLPLLLRALWASIKRLFVREPQIKSN